MNRYRIGSPKAGLPMWCILDDQERDTLALCWKEEQAQRIVDLLNENDRRRKRTWRTG